MLKLIESKISEQNAHTVKYLTVQGLKDSKGEIQKINLQMNKDFGLAGPLTLSTPSPRVHAVRWATVRECFVVETHVKRVQKEIVAASVAQLNKCPYCEDVHGASIMSLGNNQVSKAIVNNTWQSLKNKKNKQLIEWSLNTRNPNASIIKNPPFSLEEAPEIIGTALVFHSTNRLVSIFLDNSPLPSFMGSKLIKKAALKIASKTIFKSMVMKKAIAGKSLQFIPDVMVSNTLGWSKTVPVFSKALAAEEVLLQQIEHDIIPLSVANSFKEKIKNWKGEEVPLGKSWLNELLNGLTEDIKPIATIAFLAAFSPHTITENDVENFKKAKKTDTELIEVCFWATQKITNAIREWLIVPFKQ